MFNLKSAIANDCFPGIYIQVFRSSAVSDRGYNV
jgi:hypothetical protein